MPVTSLPFEQEVTGGITFVRMHKQRLYDADRIEELSAALVTCADEIQTDRVVLNLAGVDYFSSAGIGALIRFSKRLAQRKIALRLCQLQPMVEEIMFLQRLHLVFDIEPDEAAAKASF